MLCSIASNVLYVKGNPNEFEPITTRGSVRGIWKIVDYVLNYMIAWGIRLARVVISQAIICLPTIDDWHKLHASPPLHYNVGGNVGAKISVPKLARIPLISLEHSDTISWTAGIVKAN